MSRSNANGESPLILIAAACEIQWAHLKGLHERDFALPSSQQHERSAAARTEAEHGCLVQAILPVANGIDTPQKTPSATAAAGKASSSSGQGANSKANKPKDNYDNLLRKAVAEYDATRGDKEKPSLRAIGKKWGISKSTLQSYCTDDKSKRQAPGCKPGRKSLLTDEEFEELFQYTLDADLDPDQANVRPEVINMIQKVQPTLSPDQAQNYYQHTFLKKWKGRLKVFE